MRISIPLSVLLLGILIVLVGISFSSAEINTVSSMATVGGTSEASSATAEIKGLFEVDEVCVRQNFDLYYSI